jgi:putative ABC transport system permease protein
MLGIVIGVSSIIALITIVQGATTSISTQINEFGVNKITINAGGTALKRGLTQEDMKNISALENVSGISPVVSGRVEASYNGKVLKKISLQGRNEVFFKTDIGLLKSGRAINILDIESKNQVCILGSNIVKKLYFGTNSIDKELLINGCSFTVIGTLTASRGFGLGSYNDNVIIPYTTALRFLGVRNAINTDVFLVDPGMADDTVLDIKGVLNPAFNYKEDAYSIYNMGDMIDTFQAMMSVMSLLLAGIAAISLVVGGIGIMNMMLVSITERTAEIGLRKSLGATPGRIQLQFLIESIFLCIFGGIIGLILGGLIAYGVSALIGIGFSISLSTILLSVGFSAAVGIAFGYMPARKASELNPIDALRSL